MIGLLPTRGNGFGGTADQFLEALGVDPYLNGITFRLGAKAFPEVGIIPGRKHFLLNEQEMNNRQVTNSTALSSKYPTGQLAVGGKRDLWDEVISVSATIANSGTVGGDEVAQL